MSTPLKGDRVRVTYEGEYDGGDGRDPAVQASNRWFLVPADAEFEILTPPVKVGDEITSVAQLDSLPLYSVIVAAGEAVAQKVDSGWQTTSGGYVSTTTVVDNWDAVVQYVGRGEG